METRVYFVRHAERDLSVKDEVTCLLTPKGMADTGRVTAALSDRSISVVYSSPFKRAVDTIRNFTERMGLEIIEHDDFCERRVGEWVEDFRAYSKQQWEDFDFKLAGGESLKEVQNRNISALFEVIKLNKGKNIAIATHGTALSTVINYFDPGFGHEGFLGIVDKMPYILCLQFEDMEFTGMEEIEMA